MQEYPGAPGELRRATKYSELGFAPGIERGRAGAKCREQRGTKNRTFALLGGLDQQSASCDMADGPLSSLRAATQPPTSSAQSHLRLVACDFSPLLCKANPPARSSLRGNVKCMPQAASPHRDSPAPAPKVPVIPSRPHSIPDPANWRGALVSPGRPADQLDPVFPLFVCCCSPRPLVSRRSCFGLPRGHVSRAPLFPRPHPVYLLRSP